MSDEEVRQRKARAIELRRQGMTNKAIATELGVSAMTIGKYLRGEPMVNRQSLTGRAQSSQNPANNPARLVDRAVQMFDLRLSGLSYRAIAEKLGVDPRTVRAYIDREIEARVEPKVAAFRTIETARLDYYLEKLHPKIEAGDIKAIGTALRVSERRARLLGLDSPIRIDAVVTETTQADREMQELLNQAEERNREIEAQITGEVVGEVVDQEIAP